MAEISLVVESGRPSGTRASRRLRGSGRIPAVVYGHGITPIPVSVDARELRAALGTEAGTRALLDLHIGSDQHLALARQLQRHPVRHTVTHVDFQVVSRDEVVTAEVPVVLIGDAAAVHRGDGTVSQELTALLIKAVPADLPGHLELDISELEIGDSLRVADLTLPSGVETDIDPDTPIVVAQAAQVVALPEEEAAEAAEGEGEGAEGAAAGTAEGGGESGSGGSGGSGDEG